MDTLCILYYISHCRAVDKILSLGGATLSAVGSRCKCRTPVELGASRGMPSFPQYFWGFMVSEMHSEAVLTVKTNNLDNKNLTKMFQVKVLVVSFKFWGASAPPSTYLSTALQCDLIINITAEKSITIGTHLKQSIAVCHLKMLRKGSPSLINIRI